MIDDATVYFFRHAVVIAAIASFHMIDGNAQALGDNRYETTVGVAENQDAIRSLGSQNRFTSGENLSDLLAETFAPNAQVMIWRSDAQLAKEDLVEIGIVILAGMQHHLIAEAIELFNDAT